MSGLDVVMTSQCRSAHLSDAVAWVITAASSGRWRPIPPSGTIVRALWTVSVRPSSLYGLAYLSFCNDFVEASIHGWRGFNALRLQLRLFTRLSKVTDSSRAHSLGFVWRPVSKVDGVKLKGRIVPCLEGQNRRPIPVTHSGTNPSPTAMRPRASTPAITLLILTSP